MVGFLVEEDIFIRGARLVIPAFTKGKKKLTELEVKLSRQIARACSHVERVIHVGVLKNRYTILQDCFPERRMLILLLLIII